jgi:hypothetical protein
MDFLTYNLNHGAAVILLYLVAIVGMLTHYFKKHLAKQTLDDLRTYIFANLGYTVTALVAVAGVASAVIATIPAGDVPSSLFAAYVAAVWGPSYALDSIINRASDYKEAKP